MKSIPIRVLDPESVTFKVLNLQDLVGQRPRIEPLHRHDFYYILWVEKGTGTHSIDFVTYPISDRSLFLVRPGQVHSLQLEKGCTGFILQFLATSLAATIRNKIWPKLRRGQHLLFDEKSGLRCSYLLQEMVLELANRPELHLETSRSLLEVFLIHISRQISPTLTHPGASYQEEKLEAYFTALERDIHNTKMVSDYAHRLNLSPYQLNAITKANLGKSAAEVLRSYVILEAKRLLLATHLQVGAIALQLGYEDVSYFTRFFKKQTGYTPEAFRKNFT